jgi:hypothetical protein
MKASTDITGIINLYKKLISLLFLFPDEFRQLINVSIAVKNPSANARVYVGQRTIHCQKQVSKAMRIYCI